INQKHNCFNMKITQENLLKVRRKEILNLFKMEKSSIGWTDGKVISVSVTNDNKYIVSGTFDNTIGVWDLTEKKLLHRFEHAHFDEITSVVVTSDNKFIVSGSNDKTIGLWDIAGKKLLHRFEQAHFDEITSVAVTNDNKYIVSGSADKT